MTMLGSFEGTCDSTSQYMREKNPSTSTASTARLVGLVSFPRGDDIAGFQRILTGFVHGIFFPAPIENTSACLGRGIGGIRALFKVAGVRRRTQRVILVFSAVYNLLAVGLAVAGKMHPLLVAMLMPVNSLATLAIVTGGMRRVFRSSS